MTHRLSDRHTSLNIPHPCGPVATAADHQSAVTANCQGLDDSAVTHWFSKRLALLRIPKPHELILTHRGHESPIGAEFSGPNFRIVAQHFSARFVQVRIPKPGLPRRLTDERRVPVGARR